MIPFHQNAIRIEVSKQSLPKKNEVVLEGIEGIHIVADDIIIAASSWMSMIVFFNKCLIELWSAMLNSILTSFNSASVLSAIWVISHRGMEPDPAKVKAIATMPTPCDKPAVRHLLGMITFLESCILHMATITAPLRDLVKTDVHF